MATNITNTQTGQQGYQVPGQTTPAGWTPNIPAPSTPPTPPATTTQNPVTGPTNSQTTPTTTPGASTTTPTPTPAPTTPTGVDTSGSQGKINDATNSLNTIQSDYDAKAAGVQKILDGYANGSIPLNTGEQAQVDGLKSQFQSLIDQQKLANTGAEGAGNIRGYSGGAAEYGSAFQTNVIGSIITAGQQKLADLNTKMASSIATLTTSLQDADMNRVKDAFDEYKSTQKERSDALNKTITDTQKAIKDAQDDYYNRVTKPVTDIAAEAAKNGAPKDILAKINGAGSVQEAINAAGDSLQTATGALGDYLAYKRQALLVGHVPVNYDDWQKSESDKAIKEASAKAYATAYATESAKSQFVNSDKNQQALEKQYATTLKTALSNRSGGLGLQDQKVNQAIHLRALLDQYKDKNGNYTVPQVQYAELAMGLANLVSGTNSVSDSARESIMQKTLKGDIAGAIGYVTGSPVTGTTNDIMKNLADSIDRQGKVAEDLRNEDLQYLQGLAPTDLSADRKAQLEKSSMPSYSNPTHDPLIAAENQAMDKIGQYKIAHPENTNAVTTAMNSLETTLGRPATAQEFLEAFPEYQ